MTRADLKHSGNIPDAREELNKSILVFVAGVVEWLFGKALLDVRSKPADQRSTSNRPVIWRSVAELMAGMLP